MSMDKNTKLKALKQGFSKSAASAKSSEVRMASKVEKTVRSKFEGLITIAKESEKKMNAFDSYISKKEASLTSNKKVAFKKASVVESLNDVSRVSKIVEKHVASLVDTIVEAKVLAKFTKDATVNEARQLFIKKASQLIAQHQFTAAKALDYVTKLKASKIASELDDEAFVNVDENGIVADPENEQELLDINEDAPADEPTDEDLLNVEAAEGDDEDKGEDDNKDSEEGKDDEFIDEEPEADKTAEDEFPEDEFQEIQPTDEDLDDASILDEVGEYDDLDIQDPMDSDDVNIDDLQNEFQSAKQSKAKVAPKQAAKAQAKAPMKKGAEQRNTKTASAEDNVASLVGGFLKNLK